ncbi:carbohydrate-binding domain-containing protein [Pelagicoccus albus]|uniref:Carbohydrate-binding domain-containing protein n=1 Tax=Pelagicoccus albus TaxID=415222 RepID=A0A7X1B4G4_9BACT|nr:carbohydrate-binding domain-containing protein [Pelagicoccus albus]MBC2605244.1 carbohydrate-binding domain-containing protein [Pelagicoccus albus]
MSPKSLLKTLFSTASVFLALVVQLRAEVDRDRLEESDFAKTVEIVFNGSSSTVSSAADVSISYGSQSSQVIVTANEPGVRFTLSGSSSNGYLQVTSAYRCLVDLEGVELASGDGPALALLTEERSFLTLGEGSVNVLSDSATYTRDGNGTIDASGGLMVSGDGSLQVSSLAAHAIYAADDIRVFGGKIEVTAAAKDALHPKDLFRLDHGSLTLDASGDGIDAGDGIEIYGGSVQVVCPEDDSKGLATDGNFTMAGGTVVVSMEGAQSKAISADGDFSMTGGSAFLKLSGDVVLETVEGDASTYMDPSYSSALKCKGAVSVSDGSLLVTHTGLAGKGISADGEISVSGGGIDISLMGGASDSFTDEDGETDTATADAIKSDTNILITDGQIRIRLAGASSDGLSASEALTIEGGEFVLDLEGDASKGLKSKGTMTLAGGEFDFYLTGDVLLESVSTSYYDPSYCTAIKCDDSLTVSGGTFVVKHAGTAGKGVSVDGDIVMSGGSFDIYTTGGPSSTFTNESGSTDIAASDCFKADGNLTITGGTLLTEATGNAGDAISCVGDATLGVLGDDTYPIITANVSGSRVSVSNRNYSNPKGFKSEGDLVMNGGHFSSTTTSSGAEGMESKASLTIAGGIIEIEAADDGINASRSLTISGGQVYSYSSSNDGIDSNGTITISGGTVLASGSTSPEEGFDCDNNTFTITGGIVVGTGGSTSTPSSSTSTQRSVIYSGTGTKDVVLQVKSSSGDNLVYRIPRSYAGGGGGRGGSSGGSMTLLFSNPNLASSTKYTILTGVTATGGTEFHGLITGATVSGGTQVTTFTPSSMVTSVN